LYAEALQKFNTSKESACEMAGAYFDKDETGATAALVVVVNTILNLDEVITKN